MKKKSEKNTFVACLRNDDKHSGKSERERERERGRAGEREREEGVREISHYGQCAWPRHTRQTVSHSLIVS